MGKGGLGWWEMSYEFTNITLVDALKGESFKIKVYKSQQVMKQIL